MLTVDEAAVVMWRLLETQGACGCPWETFRRIPDEIKSIVPVERRILRVWKPDAVTVSAYREYTAAAAGRCLSSISFDIVESLRTRGYKQSFYGFRQAVRAYYKQQQLAAWYAR